MKILLTGSRGLLGRHLKIKADRPTHAELDITKPIKPRKYDLIIHSAAYTDVAKAEVDRDECFDVNVQGTINLAEAYPNTPFVYISSEYSKCPVNYYSLTKRVAEDYVVWHHPCHLVIRTLFKETPWKYDYAFEDAWTQGDTVEIIAPLIEKAIKEWDRKNALIYVGTGRKRIIDIARKSKPNVKANKTTDIKNVKIPTDYD